MIVRLAARTVRAAGAAYRAAGARFGGLPPAGDVRVWYGHSRVPKTTDAEVGGIVKLQALDELFPNSPRRFNILYLVSSRLPSAPALMARATRHKGGAVVVNQNGVAYPGWHGPGWAETNAPMTALLRDAAHVFYQSQFCKETADRFLGVAPARWEILHNAVDTRRFVPAPAPSDRPLTLLLGGTQYFRYRVDVALRTLAIVRQRIADARLLITGALRWPGAAAPRADADALARQLSVHDAVEWVGPYSQADAPALYQRADLLLHTKYNDPCPTVVVEAMSCGLPVVASASGGVPELIGGDGGIAVPVDISWDRDVPPDPGALADAVLRVRADRDRYAAAARARAAARFDVRAWLARHQAVFASLAG